MGVKTEDAILDAASFHFAEYGFDGASLRAILRDADANSAAAHYHFGSKEAVYRAAIERYLVPLTKQRQDNFDGLHLHNMPRTEALERLIEAYVAPHLRLCGDPAALDYMRMIQRFGAEPKAIIQKIYAEVIEPTRLHYLQALTELVPALDLESSRRLFGWITGIMSGAPFDPAYESMAHQSAMPDDPESLINTVVAMARGGILALAEQFEHQQKDDRN